MLKKTENRLALLGLVGTIPSLLIVSGGIWQMISGTNIWESLLHLTAQSLIVHPILVLGGLMFAIGLNAVAIFKIQFQPVEDSLSATVTVRWKLVNSAVFALSVFLLCGILLYAFGENFQIVAR